MSANINNKSLATYLPYSEQCLASKFLTTQNAVDAFIRLIKESHDVHRTPISEILSGMIGLTDAQKNTALEAFKALEKKDSRKKIGCQF
jgi:hypothetical protein